MAQLEDKNNLALSSISLSVCSATVEELWKLDTLGICDPVEVQSSAERDKATHEHFQQTVTRDNNGRYAVSLPSIEREMNNPSNQQVAFKRLEATTRKLVSMDKYEHYDAIFKARESEGTISKIGIGSDESQLNVTACLIELSSKRKARRRRCAPCSMRRVKWAEHRHSMMPRKRDLIVGVDTINSVAILDGQGRGDFRYPEGVSDDQRPGGRS